MVANTVSDNARYDAFRLVDVALSGDARCRENAARTRQKLYNLPSCCGPSREVRLLADLKRIFQAALASIKHSSKRRLAQTTGSVRAALDRLSRRDLADMQASAFRQRRDQRFIR